MNHNVLQIQSTGLASPKEFIGKNNISCIYTEYIENNDQDIHASDNTTKIHQTENILKISGSRDQVLYATACEQRLHLSVKPPRHYGPIIKAVFTNFKKHGRNLCVLQAEHLLIHSMDGLSHTVALPYKAKNMFAIPGGLLIQRETMVDVDDESKEAHNANRNTNNTTPITYDSSSNSNNLSIDIDIPSSASREEDGMIDGSPTLFSLLHPLDEPRPVVLPDGAFFTDTNTNIIFSNTKHVFLITHDTVANNGSNDEDGNINSRATTTIWKIECEMEKLDEFLKLTNQNLDASTDKLIEEPPSPILNVSGSTTTLQTSPISTSAATTTAAAAANNTNNNDKNKTPNNTNSFMLSTSGVKSDFSILVNGEDDEDSDVELPSIDAEIFLSPIWKTSTMENVTSVYFSEKKYICFQTKEQLIVYNLLQSDKKDTIKRPTVTETGCKVTPAFTIDCISSVPIQCHDLPCILTLPASNKPSKILQLYHQNVLLCTCVAPKLGGKLSPIQPLDLSARFGKNGSSGNNARGSQININTSINSGNNIGHANRSSGSNSDNEIFEMTHLFGAANDRANIVLGNGLVYRIQVPFFVRCGLTKKCLTFLSAVLPVSLLLKLKTEIILSSNGNQFDHLKQILEDIYILYQRRKTGRESRNTITPSRPNGFHDSEKNSVRGSEEQENIDTRTSPLVEKQNAWTAMMGSGYHLNYDNAHKVTLRCFTKETAKTGAKRSRGAATRSASNMSPSSKEVDLKIQSFLKMSNVKTIQRLLFTVDECLPYIQPIFYALHLVYEDLKLSTLTWPNLERLETVLTRIAKLLALRQYVAYYKRDTGTGGHTNEAKTGSLSTSSSSLTQSNVDASDKLSFETLDAPPLINGEQYMILKNPPDFYAWLTKIFRHGLGGSKELCKDVQPFPTLSNTSLSYKLSKVYTTLHHGGVDGNRLAMMEMVRFNVTLSILETLPIGLSLPLQEAAGQCRENPPEGWPSEAYELIGRNDLMKFEEQLSRAALHGATKQHPLTDDNDGFVLLQRLTRLRFGRDRRIKEVCRLLRSSKPVRLVVERGPEINDHDLVQAQQKRLEQLCRRSLALPVGRGMITFSSISPQLTEPLPIPEISLAGRIPPHNGTVLLDTAALHLSDQYTDWVNFHNGVAAGLRIGSCRANTDNSNDDDITRTWIIYNKPKGKPTYTHAGFLMALGLQGHLVKLKLTDIYGYLSQGHDATTVAILLGQAAAYRGSLDLTISKMLCLHIPSLLPQTISEMDVPPPVQASAILGVGLLYQSSCHRLMTEFLLEEIGRRPLSDRYADRESYALAAGIALGLVTLGAGTNIEKRRGLSDLHIEDRLHLYMVGGIDPKLRGMNSTKFGRGANLDSNGENKCSRIYEGNSINIGVTAPGATLALGLMYIKSNNEAVAQRVAIPDTHFLLDYIRPDFLMLREICANLIMWDNIEATAEWFHRQIPTVIHESMDFILNFNTGVSGDKNEEHNSKKNRNFDAMGIKQAHAYVLTGACFSLGLKFAGTAHKGAMKILTSKVRYFKLLRDKVNHKHRPDRSTLEICLGCSTLALAMVMAGTGELNTLRLFRELRSAPVEEDIKYGNHMAFGMAIGLLFLSGGHATLGRSNECIAALLCSLYPRFPINSEDNQYHLQPLRHLYVLAVEARLIRVFDAETLESCYAPLQIELKDGTVMNKIAPCLIPEFDIIERIRSTSPRHWPVTCSGARLVNVLKYGGLLLKRRTGHLSYEKDPLGHGSVLARGFPKGVGNRLSIREFCASFTEDPILLKYAEAVLGSEANDDLAQDGFDDEVIGSGSGYNSNNGSRMTVRKSSISDGISLLYRCMTSSGDHTMVRNTLILMHTVHMLPWFTDTMALQNLYLILAYYDDALSEDNDNAMIQRDFLEGIRTRVHEYLSSADVSVQSSLVTAEAMQSRANLEAHGIAMPEEVLKRLLHEI